MIADSALLQHRITRTLPHVNDTVFLAAGIALAAILHQYPFVHGWLTAKVVGLVVYILLGTMALKRGRTKAHRVVYFGLALATFGYVVSVALTHHPLGFLA